MYLYRFQVFKEYSKRLTHTCSLRQTDKKKFQFSSICAQIYDMPREFSIFREFRMAQGYINVNIAISAMISCDSSKYIQKIIYNDINYMAHRILKCFAVLTSINCFSQQRTLWLSHWMWCEWCQNIVREKCEQFIPQAILMS